MKKAVPLVNLILIISLIGVFVVFYVLYTRYEFRNFWLIYLLLIILVVLSTLRTQSKGEMLEVEKYYTITVIKCENCNYKEERKFKRGDYIFKQVGTCEKCSGNLYIDDIYVIPPRKIKEVKINGKDRVSGSRSI